MGSEIKVAKSMKPNSQEKPLSR